MAWTYRRPRSTPTARGNLSKAGHCGFAGCEPHGCGDQAPWMGLRRPHALPSPLLLRHCCSCSSRCLLGAGCNHPSGPGRRRDAEACCTSASEARSSSRHNGNLNWLLSLHCVGSVRTAAAYHCTASCFCPARHSASAWVVQANRLRTDGGAIAPGRLRAGPDATVPIRHARPRLPCTGASFGASRYSCSPSSVPCAMATDASCGGLHGTPAALALFEQLRRSSRRTGPRSWARRPHRCRSRTPTSPAPCRPTGPFPRPQPRIFPCNGDIPSPQAATAASLSLPDPNPAWPMRRECRAGRTSLLNSRLSAACLHRDWSQPILTGQP